MVAAADNASATADHGGAAADDDEASAAADNASATADHGSAAADDDEASAADDNDDLNNNVDDVFATFYNNLWSWQGYINDDDKTWSIFKSF